MTKFHVAGFTVAALSLVLTASTFTPRTTATARAGAVAPSVEPGQPMVLASGYPAPAINSANNPGRINSANWAGYAAARPGTAFRYVQCNILRALRGLHKHTECLLVSLGRPRRP